MFKKIKKLIIAMLVVAFTLPTISSVTAQANSLPDWFNDEADVQENVLGIPYKLDGKPVSRERYYEYAGLERVKDPSKLFMSFAISIPVDSTKHLKQQCFDIYPIKIWDPLGLPGDYAKWLQFRLYDDKGNMLVGSKRVKSHMDQFNRCSFNWYVHDHDKDLSYLSEGVYVIEWRCKYKDITTKWEKVPVVTSPCMIEYGGCGFRWNPVKHAKTYDIYYGTSSSFENNSVPAASIKWKKIKTVKKSKVVLRKYIKMADKDKKHEHLIAAVPKCTYKGKPVSLRLEESFYYYIW